MTREQITDAFEVLRRDLTPRNCLRLTVNDADRRVEVPGIESLTHALAIVLDRAECFGTQPQNIRAACQILWGQPCYAGRGALTLCDPSSEGGLTLATAGALEVYDGI